MNRMNMFRDVRPAGIFFMAAPLLAGDPLYQLSEDRSSLTGSDLDRVIFRSQGIFQQFALPIPATPARPISFPTLQSAWPGR